MKNQKLTKINHLKSGALRGNKKEEIVITTSSILVGATRFELTTPCSQSRCANRTALRPVDKHAYRENRCKVKHNFRIKQVFNQILLLSKAEF